MNKEKEGPSFTILQTCTGCKYYNPHKGNKCEELDIILHGTLPNENCKFLIKNSMTYFDSEISRLKNKDKAKILNIIKEIFPDSYECEYDENEISIRNEDLDMKDIENIKTRLPEYRFYMRPYDGDSFCIYFTKITQKS